MPGRFVSDGDTQAELIDGLLFESQVMADFTNLIMFFVVVFSVSPIFYDFLDFLHFLILLRAL